MPNLKTDRPLRLAGSLVALNVRRLMYQPLRWAKFLRHEAGSLRAPSDTERLQREAHSLVDGMGRDSELDRDLLGRKMLVDKPEAIQLALAEP